MYGPGLLSPCRWQHLLRLELRQPIMRIQLIQLRQYVLNNARGKQTNTLNIKDTQTKTHRTSPVQNQVGLRELCVLTAALTIGTCTRSVGWPLAPCAPTHDLGCQFKSFGKQGCNCNIHLQFPLNRPLFRQKIVLKIVHLNGNGS